MACLSVAESGRLSVEFSGWFVNNWGEFYLAI